MSATWASTDPLSGPSWTTCRQPGVADRWLCGGVTVNHHLLSDFRSGQGEALDALFTRTIASLVKQGLVTREAAAERAYNTAEFNSLLEQQH